MKPQPLSARRSPGASVAVQELDLTSLDSIRHAADELRSKHDTIDLLINNAGVMFTPKSTTSRRIRITVRHKPFGPLRVHRPAARSRARGLRFARRHRQQRGSPVRPQRDPVRRPAVGEGLQPRRRVRAGQAGQPDVHLRAAAPPAGHQHHCGRRAPGRFAHRTDPQPAAADRRSRRSWRSRFSRAPTWVRCPTLRAATDPGVIGGQYFGPDGFGEQRGYPMVVASRRASHDVDAQHRLWTVSEELTGVTFPAPGLCAV